MQIWSFGMSIFLCLYFLFSSFCLSSSIWQTSQEKDFSPKMLLSPFQGGTCFTLASFIFISEDILSCSCVIEWVRYKLVLGMIVYILWTSFNFWLLVCVSVWGVCFNSQPVSEQRPCPGQPPSQFNC